MNPWTLCLLIGSFVPIPQVLYQGATAHLPQHRVAHGGLSLGESTEPRWDVKSFDKKLGSRERPAFIPVTSVTCGGFTDVVQCPALPGNVKLGPSTLAGVGRARNTKSLAVRVMDRLQQAEAHESEPYYQQHIRQAWIILSLLQKGVSNPFVRSSYAIYGVHPDFVWQNIVADRKARLCDEYFTWYTSDDVLRPDIPKFCPNTADADTHAANGASHDDWDIAGLVPQERKLV